MNQETGYKLMSEAVDSNKSVTPVKKRADKNIFKDRFSKIVSVYVPNDDSDKVLLTFNEESESDAHDRYPKTLLQNFDENLSYQVDLLFSFQSTLGRSKGLVKCSCVLNNRLYLSFEDENQIFVISMSEMNVTSETIWLPKVHEYSLTPIEIRSSDEAIFVSGSINLDPTTRQYLIVKYDLEENVLLCTKKYPYPKFEKFDVDQDGNLIILSPQLDSEGVYSQISKLTKGFESRKYYITLGDSCVRFRPLFVAAHGADNKCWLSITKESDSGSQVEYRLMCFRCCVNKMDGDKEQLRAALDFSRWRIGNHKLGPLAVLGSHVLAIDEEMHNLCHVSWNETEGRPIVRNVSAPGSPKLIHLCSDGRDDAYLFTEYSVFRFKFVEQLIKDSEMLV